LVPPKLPHRNARAIAHSPPGRSQGIDAVIIPPATSVAINNRMKAMKKKTSVALFTNPLSRCHLSVYHQKDGNQSEDSDDNDEQQDYLRHTEVLHSSSLRE
jgi:hypothetical protein